MLRPFMPEWLKSEPVEFVLEVVSALALLAAFLHSWGVL